MVLPLAFSLCLAQATFAQAQAAFAVGDFKRAQELCETVLRQKPEDASAKVLEARLLLYDNHLDEAEKVVNSLAEEQRPYGILAQIAYRRLDFLSAADLYFKARYPAKAQQLKVFGGVPAYAMDPMTRPVELPFVSEDPLPVVQVGVNGSQPVYFLIDTGAGETVLDPDFAKQVGAKLSASQSGTFAGDTKADLGLGMVDSLQLGGLTLRNVPISTLSTKAFTEAAGGHRVSGILGTCLFYQFRATLDYPNGLLVLAPKGSPRKLDPGEKTIPIWLAGDHYMVAEGNLEKGPRRMFFIDSGLAGAAYTGPKSALTEANISIPVDTGAQGNGGGGKVPVAPFDIDSLTLGTVERRHLLGIYGPFAPSLEEALGFHLAGLVSHQFFKPYAVTFDFQAMVLRLKPGKPSQ